MTVIAEPLPTENGRREKTKADLLREYVAGRNAGLASYLSTLPRWSDDIQRDFGDDIYDRMRLDPAYSSCILGLKLAILARGLDVLPAAVPPGNPPTKDEKGRVDPAAQAEYEAAQALYAQAQELAEFCKRCINGLITPFVAHTLFNLLDCLDHGNKVAEVIYDWAADGPDKGKLILKAVKVKPRRALSFVVDRFLNVVGLLAVQPVTGANGAPATTTLTATLPVLAGQGILPRRKFLVLTCRPVDEDPRGTSVGRPAYHPWWFKMQAWGLYLKTLAQFGGGSITGTTADGAQPAQAYDGAGNPLVDANGLPVFVTPEQAMVEALQEFQAGSVVAFPFGSTVNVERPDGDVGESFDAAIDLCNREITQGILLQTLATLEGEHQARAASETHQDTLVTLVDHEKRGVVQAIRCDLLMPLIELNYGPELLPLTPLPTLGPTLDEDVAKFGSMIAALNRDGSWVQPEQKPGIDARLGLPPRDPESVEKERKRKDAAPLPGEEPPPGDDSGDPDREKDEDE